MQKIHSLVLDARMIRHSGIGVYIRNLIPYLKQAFDLSLIGDSTALESFGCKTIDCKIGVYSPKELYKIAHLAGKPDVFWTPHFNYPLWPVKARIKLITVHDLYHLAHFSKLKLVQKIYAKTVITHTLNAADKIVTVSNFSKSEIIKYYPKIADSKIDTIHLGVDTNHFKQNLDLSLELSIRVKYALPDKYVLFVGNLKHNKNAIALVKAMQALETRKQLHEHKLVITGKKDGFRIGDNEVVDYIITHKLEHLVHFTGFVDDLDLPVLYSAASLFVFPSIYEGFGLPPLEAIACGCPVICSNMASMPEVCGESVFYFDPQQEESLVFILADLLSNEDLKMSKANFAKQWIEQYDWSITAEKHIRLINDALTCNQPL
jgi:glycosyltransferase involved in cell wall biosynthesis